MPMWNGYWGAPWGWFGWIMPLIGLLFMVMMAFVCFRMMGGCMAGHGRRASGEKKFESSASGAEEEDPMDPKESKPPTPKGMACRL